MTYTTRQLIAMGTEAMTAAASHPNSNWESYVGLNSHNLRGFNLDGTPPDSLIDNIRDAYNAMHDNDDDIDTTFANMVSEKLRNGNKSSARKQNSAMAAVPLPVGTKQVKAKPVSSKAVPKKVVTPPVRYTQPPVDDDEDDVIHVSNTGPNTSNTNSAIQLTSLSSKNNIDHVYRVGSTIYWPRARFGWNSGTVLKVTQHLGKLLVYVKNNDGSEKVQSLDNKVDIRVKKPSTNAEIGVWLKNKILGESVDNIAKNILKEAIIKTKIE